MNNEENQSQEIVTTNEANALQIVDVESAVEFWENYQELTEKLLDPSDYHKQGEKTFKKKSAWRKYGTAFNISTEIIDEELTKDELGRIITAKYIVKATLPNGRSEPGVGSCSIWDKQKEETDTPFMLRKRFSNAENDVPATAHTRAKNRAISDLIGAGEVSAEEMDFSSNGTTKKRTIKKAVAKKRPVAKKKVAPKTKEPKDVVDGEFKTKEEEGPKDITPEPEPVIPEEALKKACKEYPLLRKVIPSLKADKVVLNEENFKNELIDDGRFPPSDIEKIMKIIAGA